MLLPSTPKTSIEVLVAVLYNSKASELLLLKFMPLAALNVWFGSPLDKPLPDKSQDVVPKLTTYISPEAREPERLSVEDGDVVHITIEDAHTYICEGLLSHNKRRPRPDRPRPPRGPRKPKGGRGGRMRRDRMMMRRRRRRALMLARRRRRRRGMSGRGASGSRRGAMGRRRRMMRRRRRR